ncbi:teashirt homolog 2-like [Megalops cyprinoides]|uniref:teashirt homolog 2-like n=1 Tax=Megalops cyprinoides TaxID=118141 RepID=UPI001864D164|nr:teashirt homolog 2-like [Megalops cyprinoides]
MPRRKQQAPKRAAVYMPDDDVSPPESSAEAEGDKYNPIGEQRSEENEPKEPAELADRKSSDSNRNTPVSVLSNQEAELESHLSDVSDRLSDRSDSSSQSPDEERKDTKEKEEANSSLGKMRATYANFLSDSYWTQIGLDLKVGNKANKGSCDSTNESTKSEFDWHQDALSKTFQLACSPKPVSKPSLFSSVHLQRQTSKMCGSVFTGASRFRCRECSAAYDTLVELTVHMNKSGHYRDDNHNTHSSESASKVRKRNLQVLEGKEDAQKVLKCMFCGHSFDALQDLSVHMIKTKHYQKVPLKEPIPVMPPKLVPHAKKRPYEAPRPCSPDSTTGAVAGSNLQRPYVSQNFQGGSGYQNGASYTFQFEACKSQILKCMECGSSHDTLQQLTTHMMVTGHFVKVTNSASKKGKLLALDPVAVGKMQSVAESPENETLCGTEGDKSLPKSVTSSDTEMDFHGEETERKEKGNQAKENGDDKQSTEDEKPGGGTFKFQYLREEDLGQASGGEGDILKSLANTVTTAINKAQTGTPSWSAYPSIHAAYQFSGAFKNSILSTSQPVQLKQTLNSKLRLIAPKGKSHQNASGAKCFPLQHYNMDIKKENGSTFSSIESQNTKSEDGGKDSSDIQEVSSELCRDKTEEGDGVIRKNLSRHISHKKGKEYPYSPISNGCSNASALASNTHETLRTNPLSALQSVLNNHLGKANASSKRRSEASLARGAHSMHSRLSVNLEKPALAIAPSRASGMLFPCESDDQPIDLTKSKKHKPNPPCMQSCTPVQQKHALSDIADMVKVLPKATTPKPSQPSKLTSTKLETDGQCFEDASPKRKGRQSNWNPQHLLILQAQFASSLFLTTEGKYLLSDLSPQERMHISKFTGLSMTTISHWLANVKYQLRKTGGTKFLKNMDTGYPVLHCNDCASKFRNPSAFITHLETHLGFQIKDMSKLPVKHEMQAEPEFSKAVMAGLTETQIIEDEMDSKYKCKICCRSFVSNHAVKLHLSKTHCKSPENHSQFVEMDKE